MCILELAKYLWSFYIIGFDIMKFKNNNFCLYYFCDSNFCLRELKVNVWLEVTRYFGTFQK